MQITKSELMSKGFFSSEGKMVKRIEKYFGKFDNIENAVKDLMKRSMLISPFTWEKLLAKVDKVGSLMYIFVSKSHIFGCYHY